MSQARSGYAPVDGLRMYYEVHGQGRPLVLLHGGLLTIDLSFGDLLPALAAGRRVIATELQGHGRTADIDRDLDVGLLAGDVAALLDHLGVDQADVLGFSLGGGVALQLALDHRDRVGRVILASVELRPGRIPPGDLRPGPARHLDPDAHRGRFPADAGGVLRLAPDPGHFEALSWPRPRRRRAATRAGRPRSWAGLRRRPCWCSAIMTSSGWTRCRGN